MAGDQGTGGGVNQFPWLVRKKWVLLAVALGAFATAFAIGGIASALDKPLPVILFVPLALLFVWGNGIYWWIVFFWPDRPIPGTNPIEYQSRASMAGRFYEGGLTLLFGFYGLTALAITGVGLLHIFRG